MSTTPKRSYFVVFLNPIAGKEAEYDAWYDTHIREVAALDGVLSAQRFAMSQTQMHPQQYKYAAIYEVELGKEAAALQNMLSSFPTESAVADFANAHSMMITSISDLIR
ncbi:MAG: hypothetical protein ABW034_22185 [Steroidobacteraceae bacterium]